MKRTLYIALAIMGFACHSNEKKTVFHEKYTGPLLEIDSVNTLLSDSSITKMRIIAPKQFEFVNGDRTFPNGLKIIFYKKNGVEESILTSNTGKYNKITDLYTVIGNVIVQNPAEHKRLTTEELNWDPKKKQVFTDKFVVIQTAAEILKGNGLVAAQDFSTYKILKVTGIFSARQ
jgi:LPS export ABC transporter protein LptC